MCNDLGYSVGLFVKPSYVTNQVDFPAREILSLMVNLKIRHQVRWDMAYLYRKH
jgi:hypothetical protein